MDDKGSLRYLEENESPYENEIRVDMLEATQKQRDQRKVSTHDNRSVLGKKLQKHRRNKKLSKATKKKNR